MKLFKKANGNSKLKLSKLEWKNIGEMAGWMNKIAMPVPITDQQRQEMAQDGIYVLVDALDKLPVTGKRQTEETIKHLQEQGVGDFFKTLDPKNAIMLPGIYAADPNNLIDIDGHQYYVVNVTEPRDVKKKSIINGMEYQKGDRYAGEIICMDVETGLPVPFVYDDVVDRIKTPTENREKTLQAMNDEIMAWNKRVEAIEDAVGPTKLALQVNWAEKKIQDRIDVLSAQEEALRRKQQNPLDAHPGYANWVQSLRDGIKDGQFNLRDVFDALLFLYQSNPQSLMEGIENGTVEVPDELRNGLMAIAAQELQLKGEKELADMQKERDQEIRMEENLDPSKEPTEQPLSPLTLEDIPEEKYKNLKQNRTLGHWAKSIEMAIKGIEKDKEQLLGVLNSMSVLREYVGALEKGQRSNDFLKTPEGQVIVQDMKAFLDMAQSFIKRYSVDIIENNTINPKLMGRGGSIGNALLAVALNRIYSIVRKTLDQVSVTQEVAPLEAKIKNKIQKMSEFLWKPFEDRMRLK